MTDIVFAKAGHLGLVTLNRPQALNALTLPMILALQQTLQAWAHDPDIHAVVLQAAAGKAFCAGGDVRWLYDAGRSHNPEQMQFFWHEYRLNHCIHHYPKPYIALMDGITMGGGVGLALHGSHPVASEQFVFAMPETSIGFFPDIGASHLLSRCPGYFGTYLGLTGNRVQTADAYALGLVKHVIAADQCPMVLACLMDVDLSHDAHERVSDCLQRFAIEMPIVPMHDIQASVNHCFQYPDVESIMGALNATDDAWHRETHASLSKKSPLSLKVTRAQLQKAISLSLAECLTMDYGLVNHFMQDADFYEGVRAVLVDKDQSPQWQPRTLASVSDALVSTYFEEGPFLLSFDNSKEI